MGRLILYTGFHEKGVAEAQSLLVRNEAAFSPRTRVVPPDALAPACAAARAYSGRRNAADLVTLCTSLAAVFQTIDTSGDCDTVICAPDLCGLIPGRRTPQTYEAAPILMKALVLTLRKALPAPPEVIFYFSLRAPEPWLRRCYADHLRSTRMTLTAAQYVHRFRAAADLPRIVDKIRVAVAPYPVHTAWAETFSATPLGALDPIADLLQWPPAVRDRLVIPQPDEASSPEELLATFLSLNQSDLDTPALRKAKTTAWRQWQRKTLAPRAPDPAAAHRDHTRP